jgi:hypothetical protein
MKLLHLIYLLCFVLILTSAGKLVGIFRLFYLWFSGNISGGNYLIGIETADYFLSAFLIVLIPVTAFCIQEAIYFPSDKIISLISLNYYYIFYCIICTADLKLSSRVSKKHFCY